MVKLHNIRETEMENFFKYAKEILIGDEKILAIEDTRGCDGSGVKMFTTISDYMSIPLFPNKRYLTSSLDCYVVEDIMPAIEWGHPSRDFHEIFLKKSQQRITQEEYNEYMIKFNNTNIEIN